MQTLENCVTDIYCCGFIYVCIFYFAWRKGGQSCTLKYMHMLEFSQTENVFVFPFFQIKTIQISFLRETIVLGKFNYRKKSNYGSALINAYWNLSLNLLKTATVWCHKQKHGPICNRKLALTWLRSHIPTSLTHRLLHTICFNSTSVLLWKLYEQRTKTYNSGTNLVHWSKKSMEICQALCYMLLLLPISFQNTKNNWIPFVELQNVTVFSPNPFR